MPAVQFGTCTPQPCTVEEPFAESTRLAGVRLSFRYWQSSCTARHVHSDTLFARLGVRGKGLTNGLARSVPTCL